MDITMIAAEMSPFAKVGGLGDVVGALPAALRRRGHRVRVLLPAYGSLRVPAGTPLRLLPAVPEARFGGPDGCPFETHFRSFEAGGVEVVLVDIPSLFGERMSIYGEPHGGEPEGGSSASEPARFIAFSRAAAAFVRANPLPDVVHLHDHHAALVAPMLRTGGGAACAVPVVLTIHNLAYQGMTGARDLALAGLPAWLMAPLAPCEFYGRLNALKAGIVLSDAVTTVSPSYAAEIRTAEGGFGLDGVLREASGRLSGILNGIDAEAWDPSRDPSLPMGYDVRQGIDRILRAKEENRKALAWELGLSEGVRPLVSVVARMTEQKGIDLAAAAASALVGMGFDLAFLGTGESALESAVLDLAARFPGRVAARIGFAEPLAHRLIAGSRHLLMPSRYEPCGLTQLYAMAYGTIPVARRTGGLADTIEDLDASPEGTGFLFDEASPAAIAACFERAARLAQDPARMGEAILRGMRQDRSWGRSAAAYEALYQRLRKGALGAPRAGDEGTGRTRGLQEACRRA